MSRLARNVSANLLANAWATVLSLLLTPVYVRLLGVESYGLIGFYVSWGAILAVLDTGISATAVREIAWLSAQPEGRGRIPSLIRTLEVTYWGALSVIGITLMAGAWYFGGDWFRTESLSPTSVRTALMLMVGSLVVQVPTGLYLGGMLGLQRQVETSALLAMFGTIRGAGAVAVLAFVMPDIRLFFLWQIVASAIQTGTMRQVLVRSTSLAGSPARFSSVLLGSVTQFAGATSLITSLGMVMTQVDKVILSRLVSLETFGLYMLAWSVASGLSRVATPLLQAFSPHFTELVSRGDDAGLARQVRIASQLTAALIMPPASLLTLLAGPILLLWLEKPEVAVEAAPLLAALTIGTVLVACSYPAVSVLYSRKRLRPVVITNLVTVSVLLPLLTVAVLEFGAMGAAISWSLYGFVTYVAYQNLGWRGLPGAGVISAISRDFVAPAVASLGIAVGIWYWSSQADGPLETAALLAIGLMAGWAAALAACRDLSRGVMSTLKWRSLGSSWSA